MSDFSFYFGTPLHDLGRGRNESTFAMSLMILLVLICSTKVSEKSDMAKPEQLFVAQVLIKKVKLKCCGIKVK